MRNGTVGNSSLVLVELVPNIEILGISWTMDFLYFEDIAGALISECILSVSGKMLSWFTGS